MKRCLPLLMIGLLACGASEEAAEDDAGVGVDAAGGGGGAGDAGGSVSVSPPSCTTAIDSCEAGSVDGHWTLTQPCDSASEIAQTVVQAFAEQLNCSEQIPIESVTRRTDGIFLRIDGEDYSRGGTLTIDGSLTVPSACGGNVFGCVALNLSGQIPGGSCAWSDNSCVCTISWTQDLTDSGHLAVDGAQLTLTSTTSAAVTTGGFCVQGEGMLLQESTEGSPLKLNNLWTR